MVARKTTEEQIGRLYELREEVPVPEDYILTDKIRIKNPTRKQMLGFWETPGAEADRHLFGAQADAVFALFANEPNQLYQAMISDLLKHFFGKGAEDSGKSSAPSS
jgi:hypothetical protein